MTLDEIKQLIQVVMESGVAELEVRRGDNSVRIRRATSMNDASLPPGTTPTYTTGDAHGGIQAMHTAQVASAPPSEAMVDASLVTIKSPIVGTYYDAPSPGAAPFVKIGDVVNPGHVLCIIESMKLMNEIEAEAAGVIVSKLVENGRAVEYGEALFTVKPR
jgi:acetyl-CoA carboxylase biotin carboxyl carrier protein